MACPPESCFPGRRRIHPPKLFLKAGGLRNRSRFLLFRRSVGIFFVEIPLNGILYDVFSNTNKVMIVADDMIVEPGLPCEIGMAVRPYSFCAHRFKLTDD